MISINKPILDDIDILTRCAEAYPDIVAAKELTRVLPYFVEIYHNYDQLMTTSKGYTINRSLANGNLNDEFMKKL